MVEGAETREDEDGVIEYVPDCRVRESCRRYPIPMMFQTAISELVASVASGILRYQRVAPNADKQIPPFWQAESSTHVEACSGVTWGLGLGTKFQIDNLVFCRLGVHVSRVNFVGGLPKGRLNTVWAMELCV